jgi:hypothetical protein
MMDATSMMVIQPELASGESVLWAGQPNPRVIFHKDDIFAIPFSLLWGGFAIFWEAGVTGYWGTGPKAHSAPVFMIIWGIPFVLIGQYAIWGRFFHVAWLKKRTHYAVTDRRVLVVQEGWKRQMSSAFIDSLPAISREGRTNGPGTLRFTDAVSTFAYTGSSKTRTRGSFAGWNPVSVLPGALPIFADIDEIDLVCRLVSDLREKARSSRAS